MTWHYAVVGEAIPAKPEEIYFEIREVYLNDGEPNTTTVDGIVPSGETPEEVIECLETMLKDARYWPTYLWDKDKLEKHQASSEPVALPEV